MNVGTLARTWDLMQESIAILHADKEILVFPLLSVLMLVVVDGPILLPLRSHVSEPPTPQEVYRMLFLLYAGSYFVIIFFNSALMACANIRLSGGDPALGDGFRFAWENVERMLLCVSRSSSVVGVVAAGLYLTLLYIVSTALQGIFVVALYSFTTDGSTGINPRLIQSAFSTRLDLDSGR